MVEADAARTPRRATIRDVAARAGVSPSTVSHALSGRRTISVATKQRVLDAVEALEYGADPIAASLRKGRTRLIGLVLRPKDAVRGSRGGTENFLRLIGAAATAALDRGWGLVHIPNSFDSCDTTLPVDGYIVAHPYFDDPILALLRRTRLPVVTIDAPKPDCDDWDVPIDYATGAAELLSSIDPASAPATALITGTERNRWNAAMREQVAEWAGGPSHLHSINELYEGEGARGAEELAVELIRGGASRVLTAASRFAVGVSIAAVSQGRRVPRDIEIASFTDSAMAAANTPSITAVDIRLDVAGAAGVEAMLERLAGAKSPAEPRVVRTEVRWRDSLPLASD